MKNKDKKMSHYFSICPEHFSNIDAAHTDFLNNFMKVINEVAPSKEIGIKNNSQDW